MPLPVVPPRARVEIVGGRPLRLNPPVSESIVPWGPKAGAWRHSSEAGWRDYEPEIRVAELEAETESAAARFLVSRWPRRVRQAVRDFSHGRWRVILHADYCGPHSEKLLASHEVMGWLVAYRERFRPGERDYSTWEAARRLTGLRRRCIAAERGFPECERTVRAALHREGAERLRKLRRVNQAAAAIVARLARLAMVTQRSLETVAEWVDCAEMERCLEALDEAARRPHRTFDTPQELAARPPLPAPLPRMALAFPPPPLPETSTIQAIRSRLELDREGRKGHHLRRAWAWVPVGAGGSARSLQSERASRDAGSDRSLDCRRARRGNRPRTFMKNHINKQGQGEGKGDQEDGDHAPSHLIAQCIQVIDLRNEFGDGSGFGVGWHPS